MRVKYIQAVCPHCNRGLYVTGGRANVADEYYCRHDGFIEPYLVRHIVCEYQDDTVLMPAPYSTNAETSAVR